MGGGLQSWAQGLLGDQENMGERSVLFSFSKDKYQSCKKFFGLQTSILLKVRLNIVAMCVIFCNPSMKDN